MDRRNDLTALVYRHARREEAAETGVVPAGGELFGFEAGPYHLALPQQIEGEATRYGEIFRTRVPCEPSTHLPGRRRRAPIESMFDGPKTTDGNDAGFCQVL
jgi:hypothetical protein